jgi:hypothetical protein
MTVTAVPSRPLLHPLPAHPAEAAPGALRHPEPNRDLPPGTGVFFARISVKLFTNSAMLLIISPLKYRFRKCKTVSRQALACFAVSA